MAGVISRRQLFERGDARGERRMAIVRIELRVGELPRNPLADGVRDPRQPHEAHEVVVRFWLGSQTVVVNRGVLPPVVLIGDGRAVNATEAGNKSPGPRDARRECIRLELLLP